MIKVYGDIMLDRWIVGKARRISPEAPVPVLKEVEQQFCPGGAGNLAVNIANLNGQIGVYGSIASDKEGYQIIECFSNFKKINFRASMDSKLTTTKNRLVGQGGQHICRWDREEKYTGVDAFHRLLGELQEKDIVCISDYAKGTVREGTIQKLLKRNCKILVDPKQDVELYRSAFLVKPNLREFKHWFGKFSKEKAQKAVKDYNWTWLVVTAGANGMHVFNNQGQYKHFQEPAQEVADVTGAGDTVLAVLAYLIDEGHDVFDACEKACYAAARAVEHRGVHVVSKEDIQREVIFTNGVFDVLHAGHLKLLKYAKSKGTKLVVGINSDESVQRIKGDDRPINDIASRIEQLEELPWVDEVKVFTEDTPYTLIQEIKPNLIVKGGDYQPKDVVGADIAEVDIFPRINNYSTTKIVEKIHD
tara:strand:+ start:5013 stop:6266 length:1254 start_codon:yes stop_codon:yes gene_type:complete